jgi:hypothetical protein
MYTYSIERDRVILTYPTEVCMYVRTQSLSLERVRIYIGVWYVCTRSMCAVYMYAF